MEHYAGIDVSLELSSVCVVDDKGKIVKEVKITSDPDALAVFFKGLPFEVERIGIEAGPLSQWLHAGLTKAGFETVLLETRHVKAALSAMTVKTDRKDARGIAQLVRMGWFRPVHCKSFGSQEVRALLVARKLLLTKLLDLEFSIRGILRGFGLKMGAVTRKSFETRVRELCAGQEMLEQIAQAMLAARCALQTQYARLHKTMLSIVRHDKICRRLMTAPGVGPLVAITFKTAVDDPRRIAKSKTVGALFGLTPKKYQSGETDVTGGITRVGDEMARTALYEAANVLLSRVTRFSALKRWGMDVAKRRGMKRAKVALARKIGVILHRMWVDGTSSRWTKEPCGAEQIARA
jgi:transposase